jgi:hypothetical protein
MSLDISSSRGLAYETRISYSKALSRSCFCFVFRYVDGELCGRGRPEAGARVDPNTTRRWKPNKAMRTRLRFQRSGANKSSTAALLFGEFGDSHPHCPPVVIVIIETVFSAGPIDPGTPIPHPPHPNSHTPLPHSDSLSEVSRVSWSLRTQVLDPLPSGPDKPLQPVNT